MTDSMSLGPVPYDESCEQLGPQYSPRKARIECRAYINQLTRVHGEPPETAYFKMSSNPHDFGTYYEVEIVYEPNDDRAVAYAIKVENESLAEWDAEARIELAQFVSPVTS